MSDLVIGIADDEEIIHNGLKEILGDKENINVPSVGFESFYETDSLKDFLYDNPDRLNVLILDVNFKGGETGIEALPKIKEYVPNLPIILLTADKDPSTIELAFDYILEYLPKPIDSNIIIIAIKRALYKKTSSSNIRELLDINAEMQMYVNRLEKRLFEDEAAKKINNDLKKLIQILFDEIEFTPQSLSALQVSDERLIRLLKSIDHKDKLASGANVQKFKKFAKENIWEYRFGRKERVFVQYESGKKPLIWDIDYTHSH